MNKQRTKVIRDCKRAGISAEKVFATYDNATKNERPSIRAMELGEVMQIIRKVYGKRVAARVGAK